jgi:nitroreductase
MEFQTLVNQRYSVRDYKPDELDSSLLDQVLTAGQFAPTAANRQPFKIIVIHTKRMKGELLKIYNRAWFSEALIVLCACGIPDQSWVRVDGKSYLDVDIAIVMDHISLAAANLGLGTCWVASFDVDAARKILHIPSEVEPIIMMSLGYPAGSPGEKERKSLDELISYRFWDSPEQ